MDQKGLARVEKLSPRDVWKHEALDLTPWVADNLDLLGEALGGVGLTRVDREVAVGDFALDVLAKDDADRPVIIENQLEQTDHSHLGQLLVYASGLDAAIIVWLTPKFRDEHRQALDWLNEHTSEEVHFFGIELEVIRIADSPPAPQFRLVAQPNEWQKAVMAPGGLSELRVARHDFFERALAMLGEKLPSFRQPKVGYENWISFKAGPFGNYAFVFNSRAEIVAEIYIDTGDRDPTKAIYDALETERPSIEAAAEGALLWERLDNRRACRISSTMKAPDFQDEAAVDEAARWIADKMSALISHLDDKLRALAKAQKSG